jgi:hypothetical protein
MKQNNKIKPTAAQRDDSKVATMEPGSSLIPFDQFLKSIGRDRGTGYRYRRAGMVKTVNIFGRVYITAYEINRFIERAKSGEFARQRPTPFGR